MEMREGGSLDRVPRDHSVGMVNQVALVEDAIKIAFIGSGGGGHFGARLAAGGADVWFLACGEHLRVLWTEGIRIEGSPFPILIPSVAATNHPDEVECVDYALIAVKLWNTDAALRQIAGIVGPGTALISLQNGVPKDGCLKRALDPAQVMSGVGYVATTIERPVVVRLTARDASVRYSRGNASMDRRTSRSVPAWDAMGGSSPGSPRKSRPTRLLPRIGADDGSQKQKLLKTRRASSIRGTETGS